MNAAGWFVVGMLLGCSVGTVLAGLMVAARRGDDLATFAGEAGLLVPMDEVCDAFHTWYRATYALESGFPEFLRERLGIGGDAS